MMHTKLWYCTFLCVHWTSQEDSHVDNIQQGMQAWGQSMSTLIGPSYSKVPQSEKFSLSSLTQEAHWLFTSHLFSLSCMCRRGLWVHTILQTGREHVEKHKNFGGCRTHPYACPLSTSQQLQSLNQMHWIGTYCALLHTLFGNKWELYHHHFSNLQDTRHHICGW